MRDFYSDLLKICLESSSQSQFLGKIASRLHASAEFSSIAILRANTPNWQTIAFSGVQSSAIPFDLASEALDREELVSATGWHALLIRDSHSHAATPYVLCVQSKLSEPDLQQIAMAIGYGLAITNQHRRSARRVRRLETILELTNEWHQTNEMETLLVRMAKAATDLLSADRASIFLWDKPNKQLIARPALGLEDSELRLPDDAGIVGQVIQSGEPRRVSRSQNTGEIDRSVDKSTGYDTNTILCVPLVSPTGDRFGAFEVLNKTVGDFTDEDEVGLIELASLAAVALEGTQQREELISRNEQLIEQASEGIELIGTSPSIEALRSTIQKVADTDLAILILGENGTGKEVVAQSMHYQSRRRNEPFIAVNCAAIAETLLESELFGHEKGAFTDAHESRQGKFELASGGTLLLDEIGDMSLAGQAKLLRVLEEKTIVRVGGSTPIHTEVRILAATNQNLSQMVREKKFREDLFFRLNVVCLELPPLRERGDDIFQLADFFLSKYCKTMGRKTPTFTAAARKRLLMHPWPGNIRELRNLMERIAYLSSGDKIDTPDLAFILAPGSSSDSTLEVGHTLSDATKLFQQQYIRNTIDRLRGNVTDAAKTLGVHRSNLYRKMKQLEMESEGE